LMRIRVGYPDEASEREIVRTHWVSNRLESIEPVMDAAEIIALQDEAQNVTVDEELVTYTVTMVARTRQNEFLSLGVSPRGSMALFRAAQSLAFLRGRNYATPDDFKRLAVPVFAHRV